MKLVHDLFVNIKLITLIVVKLILIFFTTTTSLLNCNKGILVDSKITNKLMSCRSLYRSIYSAVVNEFTWI